MTKENALVLRSMHKSFAVPYLKGLFGEAFDYAKIRTRRMELMQSYLAENPLELKKGAVELLEFLRKEKIPAAVCTATDYDRAAEYLKKAGIFDYFDKIISAAMVEKGKPMPDVYLYAAKELGSDPKDCVALEDSPNGVNSAASAGFITVMVPDLTEPDDEMSKIILKKAESLIDVIDIIRGI